MTTTTGVTVGHWTDESARTGCTVILFDRLTPAVVDVRGGAPGTRETDLLEPGSLLRAADAILLSGGSAFGLTAADGVVDFLRERQRGYPTPAGPVPIVPAAILYDLGIGEPIAPDRNAGFLACSVAVPIDSAQRGRVGAGTGATIAKFYGPQQTEPGGLGIASRRTDTGRVIAIAAVNAAGAIVDPATGLTPDGIPDPRHGWVSAHWSDQGRQATTLVAVLVDAPVGYDALERCAVAAHDGVARAVRPAHTAIDGDLVFAAALQQGDADLRTMIGLGLATELAVETAIQDAVRAP